MDKQRLMLLLLVLVVLWAAPSSTVTLDEARKDFELLLSQYEKYAIFERSEGPNSYQATDIIREKDITWYLIVIFKGSNPTNLFIQKEIDYGDNYKEVYRHGVALIENVSSYEAWHEYRDGLTVTESGIRHIDPMIIWKKGIRKFKDKYERSDFF